jgi:6-phosphogluconolactonase (cycloisomerase 2 family)
VVFCAFLLIPGVEKDTLSGMKRNLRRLCHNSVLAGAVVILASSGVLFGQVNLYVPNIVNTPSSISEFNINSTTGTLTTVSGQPSSPTDDNPARVSMTPNNKFLYISNGNGQIDAYLVAPNGFLTPIAARPGYGPVASPVGIVANNNNVYVAGSTGQIAVFSINQANGTLTAVPCSFCSTGAGSSPQNLVLDPTNTYLYVALPGKNAIGVGTIGAGGTLTAFNATAYVGPSSGPSLFTPQDLALTPSGTVLYASNYLGTGAGTNYITPFTVAGATLTVGTNVTTGFVPHGLTINPAGNFLYVANQGSNNVSGFSIGAGGALTAVPGSPFAAGTQPLGASADPTGKFVYVSNFSDNTVTGYAIAANGSLTPVPGSPFATGTGPYYLLAHLAPTQATVPAASTWSLAVLGILLASMAGLLYRKAYR